MQPIHYSLTFNLLALVICGLLSWQFNQPLLVIVALLVAQHTTARFEDRRPTHLDDDDDDDDGGRPIGFTADV